ncbi:IS4 family transposase [Methanobrevibacter arboriphilus]|uniref:IS4 family transposase n=1 Tax=Methanobrevibacter arboriphilus TaxID=39441 RepID=UPI0005B2D2CA|nr:IS4 family transposase [Methanobrevibacter arboriphilus]
MELFNRVNSVFDDFKSENIIEQGRLFDTAFVRNRKLSFDRVALFLLNKNGLTQTLEAYNFSCGLNIDNFSRQAFCQARMKFNPQIFKIINMNFLRRFYHETEFKTFKGYKILAIDGSVIDLPNKKSLKEIYGGIKGTHSEFIKLKAQSSGIYDCLNNMMIDFQLAPYKTSEKELVYQNIEQALKLFKNDEIILIFDRGYPSIEFFQFLTEKNIKFIFRIKKDNYKSQTDKIEGNEGEINLKTKKNKEKLFNESKLSLRVNKIPTKNNEVILISNLPINEVSYDEIAELYRQRWEIEKSFEILKNKLYIENISGYSKIAVEQDFYSQILTYNIVKDINNKANEILKQKQQTKKLKNKIQKTIEKKEENKIKINMNHLIGYFRKNILKIYKTRNIRKKYKIFKEMLEITMKSLTYGKAKRHFKRTNKRTTPKNKTNIRRNS